jgi:FMN-dependent NADH-azoreductase|tara:strand:+ start:22 stop:375 length:354 start_codon:yes stop_codon:yes gene_type:complete
LTNSKEPTLLEIGAPIYNLGVPSGIKVWIDLAARAGRIFGYTESGPQGLVTGKPVYIASASGGAPTGSAADFATPHLTQFLALLGFTDITMIHAAALMLDPTKAEQAETQTRQLASV